MGEQNKILSRPIFCRDAGWDPFPNWTQPSRILQVQDFGFPPFLEPNDLDWLTWARKRLASMSWPEFAQTPLLSPLIGRQPAALGEKDPRHLTNGVSEILTGRDSWKISLDVNHFSPEDITITTKEGYLLISGAAPTSDLKKKKLNNFEFYTLFLLLFLGKHEEKQDQQGVVSRCFNRRYK